MTESRWIRLGGVAGLGYVLISVAAAALPGVPPPADGNAITAQTYFVEHHQTLVSQAWLYGWAAPLMLMFAISVRRVLRKSAGGYFGELFLLGTAMVAGLLLVAMAMQIAVVERADTLPAEVVFAVGVHFVGVLIGMWGFLMGAAAGAYAFSVFAYGALPKWTGCLAALTFVVDLAATAGVFFRTGPLCLEGGFSAWAPAAALLLWYLGTSIALLRKPAPLRK
jgi:hypothetical protein